MKILLEPGMIIKYGDKAISADETTPCSFEWEPMNEFLGFGEPYQKEHVPMIREINTIKDLFDAYNFKNKQKG